MLIVAVVLIGGVAVVYHNPVRRQLAAWRLLPQSQRLTELYFTSPSTLPTHYAVGKTQLVAFTIHNLQFRTERYDYRIVETSQAGNVTRVLKSGAFVLSNNAYRRQLDSVSLIPLGYRVQVSVTLTNNNQSIYYWVTRST